MSSARLPQRPRSKSERERVPDDRGRTPAGDRWLLLALMVVGLLVRLDYMRAGNFVIDSDEAIVGLMGKHIMEGKGIPTFYYGQHYMGSLEPLCVALSFALFGISSFTLQLVPLLFSLLLIWVLYRLGREVGGAVVGRVAAVLCALPPAALLSWSFKARGGFIELLVIGALALLCTVRSLRRPVADLACSSLVWFILGVGWWVNNQILYFMVPVACVMGARGLRALLSGELSIGRAFMALVSALGAFGLGGAPYWIYNVGNNFPSLGMFSFAKPEELLLYFQGLWSTALPIIFGAKHFWEQTNSFSTSTTLFYLAYGTIFTVVIASRRREIVALLRGEVDPRQPLELFFLFCVAACAIFTVSSFGWLSQAPRYLLPLYVGLFIITGAFVQLVSKVSRGLGVVVVFVMVGLNLASCYSGGRALPGEPIVYDGERVSRDHRQIIDTLESLNIRYVRTNYWIGYRLAFETRERVLFGIFGEPRQVRIREYQEPMLRQGSDRVPLLIVPKQRESLERGLRRLGYSFDVTSASGYVLVYNLRRSTPELSPVPASLIARAEGSGQQHAASAMDGSLETRWGTGQSQRSGQFYKVFFREPVSLRELTYRLGAWPHDYPRSLQIELVSVSGDVTTVLSADDYRDVAPLLADGDLKLPLQGPPSQSVVLRQLGSHPVVDWSIAELSFMQDAQANLGPKEASR